MPIQHSTLSCCSSHHQSCSDDSLLHLIHRNGSFHLSNENIGGLLSHGNTPLLHRSEHRVGSLGTVTIGKSADTNFFRHLIPHTLGSIENTDSRIIIDGKECIRTIFCSKNLWCERLSLCTVVADLHPVRIFFQSMLQESIPIAVVAVLEISIFIGDP